jgi:methionyl-tRNA formyltransferase
MRIVFMGSAELACPCLKALTDLERHAVIGVVTQPDRPKGRDLRPASSPVKILAQKLGVQVLQPLKIGEASAMAALREMRPDLIVVVAYGQILPKAVLDLPPQGCVNVHTSLLPRWRGAAPIQHAILNGDATTGVTTMYMDERMDTGDIIFQRAEPIRPDDTSASLHERLAALGAKLLVETVEAIADGQAPRTPQDNSRATYAPKLRKEDGRIDWKQPAVAIERQLRAFDPWPGAFTFWGDTMLKLWRAEVTDGRGAPGEVLSDFTVATGNGALRVLEAQSAGGKRMSAEDFLRGHRIFKGDVLR